eukprot:CAMPEP_0195287422 /NCGR_PEP_ID=MMETSP0707-20130614/4487_1 /TAXON_ID=33640 /ORGANISM="Asterionellopsis glacialis, Strain CCMP134" /LENGTH=1087 /DNA_ID=CAMNT_0040347175 /DNA_START=103 /DNA_END=3366 /DNA_ORIENTATION=-
MTAAIKTPLVDSSTSSTHDGEQHQEQPKVVIMSTPTSPGEMTTSDFEKSSNGSAESLSSFATMTTNATYAIQPPTTQDDDGKPSSSLLKDVERILALVQDERHLIAHKLSLSVQTRFDQQQQQQQQQHEGKTPPSTPTRTNVTNHQNRAEGGGGFFHKRAQQQQQRAADAAKEKDYQEAQTLWASRQSEIEKLSNRARLFERSKHNLSEKEDWTYSQTLFGITTYYRHEPDNSLSIKLEGTMSHVPIFEQIAVLKEVDLYYKWAPFCTSSLALRQLDKLDVLGWIVVGLPNFGLMRDGCFRAIGCDCMKENGTILLVGQGVADQKPSNANEDDSKSAKEQSPPPQDTYLSNDPTLPMDDIPSIPKRLGAGRMTIRNFDALIEVVSPTEARTKVVSNINPNVDFIPPSLLEFVMRKMVGILLYKLQNAAKKAQKHPVQNIHARRMRQESQFYKKWLYPKFESLCKERRWEMLPVPALDLTDDQQEQDFLLYGSGEHDYQQNISSSDGELPRTHSDYDEYDEDNDLLAAARAPSNISEYQHMDDVSDVSDVSTTSTWSKNPISSYLREVEARTQRKKKQKIMASRMRAAHRLKRKSLTIQQKTRLGQLKAIKTKRKKEIENRELGIGDGNSMDSSIHDEESTTDKLSKFLFSLHCYSPTKRYQIMVGSFGFMMILFYFTSIFGFSPPLTPHSDKWWVTLLQNVGTIIYLSSCAIVHYLCCNVALVYAFETLELGGKTGGRSKQYYNDQLRAPVALFSGGIVLVSIAKALGDFLVRALYWYTLQTSNLGKSAITGFHGTFLENIETVVPQVAPVLSFVENMTLAGINAILLSVDKSTSLMLTMVQLVENITIHSHWLGRTLENAIIWLVSAYQTSWKNFVDNAYAQGEGSVELASWRFNAIETSKFFLVHTGIFLLTTLFLYSASAKKASNPTKPTPKKAKVAKTKLSRTESPRGRTVSNGDALTSDFVSPLAAGGVESATAATTTASRGQFFGENYTIAEDEEEGEENEDIGPLISPPSYAHRFPKSTNTKKKKKKRLFKNLRLFKKNKRKVNKDDSSLVGGSMLDGHISPGKNTLISVPRSRAATVDF